MTVIRDSAAKPSSSICWRRSRYGFDGARESAILPLSFSKFLRACFQSCSGMMRGMKVTERCAFSRVSTSLRMRAVSKAPAILEISRRSDARRSGSDSCRGAIPMSSRNSLSCV